MKTRTVLRLVFTLPATLHCRRNKSDNERIEGLFGRRRLDSPAGSLRRRVLLKDGDAPSEVNPETIISAAASQEVGAPVAVVDSPEALSAVEDAVGDAETSSVPAESMLTEHQLVDDDFLYLPVLPKPLAVPGQRLVPPDWSRYRMVVQYRGDRFAGWTKSMKSRRADPATQRTAEEAISDSLCVAMDLDEVDIVPAAVPEVGVHCRRLVCHFDVPGSIEMQPRTILQRAHVWLSRKGDSARILSLARARPEFQARYSALRRVYVYRILNRIAPPLFDDGLQWHIDRTLDVAAMRDAAKLLEGEHDFGPFADRKIARALESAGPTYSLRTLEKLEVVRQEDEVHIWFVAKSFLRHQIRNIVGTLEMFGQGLWRKQELTDLLSRGFDGRVLAERYRPPPAPVCGLTLWDVEYPKAHSDPSYAIDSGLTSSEFEDATEHHLQPGTENQKLIR